MKSKIAILSLLLTGAAVSASAQTKEHYYSEKAKDNIFISVGVGAQGCVNPDNFDYGFGRTITPLIHASVGKLFDPIWGIQRPGSRMLEYIILSNMVCRKANTIR